MNKDKILIIVISILLILGVTFLCISMFDENRVNHHPLPIAMCCICSANALVVARSIKRNRSNNK